LAPTAIQPNAAASIDTPASPVESVEDRHAIFGQLGRAMAHATAFQLGRFDLDRHFDMIEQGMPWHPSAAKAQALGSPRDLHDLDVMAELTSLSQVAGIPLRHNDDSAAFRANFARAQATRLTEPAEAHEESTEEATAGAEDEEASETENAEQEQASPWSAQNDDEPEDDGSSTEEQNG
jgi:hypothetical protein